MSILIGLAHEPVFNAAVATQIVFQQPVNAAIRSLQAEGTLARIVARYAPQAHVVGPVEIR
ncbi:hypothetical protein QM298_05030 [Pseudomonas mendocina]|nr:hypothetical protein [Pseudomonas mendocina]MDV5860331.1 hypothetical protein [Pseudomonas mendocina]